MRGGTARALRPGYAPWVASRRIHGSTDLPYRIRVPLAKLRASKEGQQPEFRAPALGDGETLEGSASYPDYMALCLRSRVYDHLSETPLQYLPALSESLNATVHLKREDLLPTFTFYIRCAVNELAMLRAAGGTKPLVTASIGSRGHALAWAAQRPGLHHGISPL